MATHFVWNGPAAKKHIEAEMEKRVKAACYLVQNRVKVLLSVEGTARRAATTTVGGKKKRKGSLIYGANPSVPPAAPHLQTGRLRASIASEVVGLVGRVGSNLNYARPLQTGWSHSAARPYLDRGLSEKAAEVEAILSRPIDF